MNTLHLTSDQALQESLLHASGQKVWLLEPDAPVAQAAEAVVKGWKEQCCVSLILVPEARLSAFLEVLRPRILKLPAAEQAKSTALVDAVRQLTDTGACLVAGGEEGQPALVCNLILNRSLLASLGNAAPLLLVATLEENAADLDSLRDYLRPIPASV
ncbi:MAG: hypothetical protein ACYTEP_09345 [Planctomycetota bacterium]|jgi:hypothetical protein